MEVAPVRTLNPMKKTARRPRRLKAQVSPLIARYDAAGVDLGATLVTAALPPSRPGITVRTFATFTPELRSEDVARSV